MTRQSQSLQAYSKIRVAIMGIFHFIAVALPCVCFATNTNAQGTNICGELANAYGPFDYRTERNGKLKIVESHHFTLKVELLQAGQEGYLAGDIDYTLRASPNHHRALMAISKLAIRENSIQLAHTNYTVDCYFDRAMRFQPSDIVPPLIYAQHLLRTNRREEALRQLHGASVLGKENPLSHYNLGLLYLEAKELDKALEHAVKARDLGNPKTALLDKLRAAGKEPPVGKPAETGSR